MKNVVILGSTGSIGRNALRVARALPARVRVVGLAANRDWRRVLDQAARFDVRHVALADPAAARRGAAAAPRGVRVYAGAAGVATLAAAAGADLVLCAVVGLAGLRPVLAAVANGTDVALATKEVLVAAGRIVTAACAKHGARLLPVDSEHSAILQCLTGRPRATDGWQTRRTPARRRLAGLLPRACDDVRRIVLTASGGPFGSRPEVNLNTVSVREVLRHPRWSMGRKVTVDSATLMNKGLEIIEAHWLFGFPLDRIEVVVHPESVVHSLVEFADGALLAQLSVPDMRFAIQYALVYPERVDGGLPALRLARMGGLHFEEPDRKRFPCLGLAREAGRRGGTLPAVLNAANEVAVKKFLDRQTRFSGIWRVVEAVMDKHRVVRSPSLEDILAADDWARRTAEEIRGF